MMPRINRHSDTERRRADDQPDELPLLAGLEGDRRDDGCVVQDAAFDFDFDMLAGPKLHPFIGNRRTHGDGARRAVDG